MKVVFRVDASLFIGNGHVMRCLALADVLRNRGAECRFISRQHDGNLLGLIRQHGFEVIALQSIVQTRPLSVAAGSLPNHADWLGETWLVDAAQTSDAIISNSRADWLIVDHYALDVKWEQALRSACGQLMVIDDLADRPHDCDVLLDQNLGRRLTDYTPYITDKTSLLTGPEYALLRSEFAIIRPYSLKRREKPMLKQLLISMGGVDKDNATGRVLTALRGCSLPSDCRVTVVMGPHAPWLTSVYAIADAMPWQTEVLVNIPDMAQHMADSDLAIGAAGSTSWERCCLGLPAVVIILADNQWAGAQALDSAGAAIVLGGLDDIGVHLSSSLSLGVEKMAQMGKIASRLTQGLGATLVAEYLEKTYRASQV